MTRKYTIVFYRVYAEMRAEASRSFFGVLWWVIEPILYMIAFYFVFSALRRNAGIEYIVFLLVGLVSWKWFASGITTTSNSIQSNLAFMNQIYLPKEIFVYVPLLISFFKFLIVFLVLIVFLSFVGYPVNISWIHLPAIFLSQFLLILGLGALLAAIMPFYSDIRLLVENAILMLFFMSGIFFDINEVSGSAGDVLRYNPIAVIMDGFRSVLLRATSPQYDILLIVSVFCLAAFLIALGLIKRYDKIYPKIILR